MSKNEFKEKCKYCGFNLNGWCTKLKTNNIDEKMNLCEEEKKDKIENGNILNVYVVERKDKYDYDEYIEQTIVALNEENALIMASKEYGNWKIKEVVDLTKEQILTKDFNAG